MSGSALEALLRRDRAVVAGALAAVVAISWAYILWLAAPTQMGISGAATSMPGMDMTPAGGGAAAMAEMLAPSLRTWSANDALLMSTMWAVMMIGMMTPSAAPMILIYARVGRQAAKENKPFASSAWFASGYLACWAAFALAATGAQWGMERAALLTPMMAAASPLFGALVLVGAGLYQWTSIKDSCLKQCQSPFLFIQRHGGFRRDPAGAVLLGIKHGAYCVGCCWALMALLFVGGVMNALWIGALTILVLAEKIVPAGRLLSRIAGAGLVAAGGWLLFTAII